MDKLNQKIVDCYQCERLVAWREEVAQTKRRQFIDDDYWGKAVPSFGSLASELLIVGLAPAAHGANRTGRMFTGDRSGDWLYRALHKAGFANQPESTDQNDGLELNNCRITAVCHCAPPQNKVTREEILACQPFLMEEILSMPNLKALLCLGSLAWTEAFRSLYQSELLVERFKLPLNEKGKPPKRPAFGHNVSYVLSDSSKNIPLKNTLRVFGSYHPSQQNTFTGRLTEPMFDSVFEGIQGSLSE